jgi:hypothetical protein
LGPKEKSNVSLPKENFEERNGRIIQFINPKNVFGRKMQTLRSWMK